ncbi:hypothetical protein VTJ83DRAFT_759 [Remersonia thermophila]|uniref:Acetoacetate decarboxylase n=1 Tax=Remersonia thermophila TaxID=72144 RepID=A0ABR4DLY0_9PEZI
MSTTTAPTGPIALAPAPWKTEATVYMIPFWISQGAAASLPVKVYHPLEAESAFSSRAFGIPKGGFSLIMLIRYHATPVGPYDEMAISPGFFEYPVEDEGGGKATKSAMRVTSLYVSQKYTCWNGRTIWNFPKHLAHFHWIDNPDGSTHIRVFPHDHTQPFDPASPPDPATTKPFFQCTISPIPLVPSFPFTSSILSYIGLDLKLVQPPLPDAGPSAHDRELPGTEGWSALIDYGMKTKKATVMWGDFSQGEGEGEEFLPGMLGKKGVVTKLERAEAWFNVPERWDMPRHLL